MLSSLLRGPKTLEKKTITFNIEVLQKDGSKIQKERTKNVIDNKEVVESKNFIIGHSDTNSETFLPTFIYDDVNDIFYGDIAGLQDTSGPLIDFINSFMVKKIF